MTLIADLPSRIICFEKIDRDTLKGQRALSMMPLLFTTGDFQTFAGMGRIAAEQALNELELNDMVLHIGNKWQRIGDNAHTIGATAATSRRMEFIWAMPPEWITAPAFADESLTHREVARQFLIDRWNRREAEKDVRVVKSGLRGVKMHLFRRIVD